MRCDAQPRGSILIMTTWLLAIVALLALGISHRGQLEVRLVSYDVATAQTRLAALAGVQRALEAVAHDTNAFDAWNEPWASSSKTFERHSVRPGQTTFTVSHETPAVAATVTLYGAEDESSRLNLNSAAADVIAALPGIGNDVAQSLVAFRDAAPHPAEDAYYGSLAPPYAAKRAVFESLAEVALVRGMTPERFAVVARYGTVYPKLGSPVNVNTAPREVLLALGLSPALVNGILAYRLGGDGRPGTDDDGVFQQTTFDPAQWSWMSPENAARLNALMASHALDVRSSAIRIRAEGRTEEGAVTVVAEAVVLRGAPGTPPHVVAWQWQ